MKRVISALILAAFVLTLSAAAGCKSTDSGNDASATYQGDVIPGGTAEVTQDVMDALQNSGNVSTYVLTDDKTSRKPLTLGWFYDENFIEYFEQVYGGTIETVYTTWEGWENKFISDFAAGDAPDLIYNMAKLWPKTGNRGMVYSNKELQELGVLGLDHPMLQDGIETVERNFTFKDETYGFALHSSMCFWAIVNTDLFAQYNVKSPVDYYNEGLWNLDALVEAGNALVKAAGTDESGNKAVTGYYCWDPTVLVRANGQQIVGINAQTGELTLNMDKNEVLAAFEIYSNGMKSDGFMSTKDTFNKGNTGILAATDENLVSALKDITFNWEIIPFPKGSANTNGQLPGSVRAWCVTSSSQNPQGAVNMVIALKAALKDDMFDIDEYDIVNILGDKQDTLQMINDNAPYGVNDNMYGVGNLWGKQFDFWTALRQGTANEVVQTYTPMFNAQVQQEAMSTK